MIDNFSVLQTISEADTIRQAAGQDRLLEADLLGVSDPAMARATDVGALRRIAPGVYLGVDHATGPLTEGAGWTLRHPDAVIGLLTAALVHDLTDAFPRGSWLFVPKGSSPPRSAAFPVQVVQSVPWYLSLKHDDDNGIEARQVHGVTVRQTGLDRTVIDLWRYPRRIPEEFALEALRRRAKLDDFRVPDFARLARRLGAWGRMEPVVQGLMLR